MIYPIVLFGDPVLKKRAENISDFEEAKKLIDDLYETMYNAGGVGLAAPQIGKSVRVFVIDAAAWEDEEDLKDFKKVFVNAEILTESEDEWKMEEGCLSIPGMREDVVRPEAITIRYLDENFEEKEEEYEGLKARIIQHEYDHIEGILYTEHLSAFRRSLIKRKLDNISKGIVDVKYPIRAPRRR